VPRHSPGQKFCACRRDTGENDPGENDPPVMAQTRTPREAVRQTRDIGVPREHPARDFAARRTVLVAPAQDSKEVVLRL
jgi:hypothetical protein